MASHRAPSGECSNPRCQGKDRTLAACSQCLSVAYCGPTCQKAHWAEEHKAHCVGLSLEAYQDLVKQDFGGERGLEAWVRSAAVKGGAEMRVPRPDNLERMVMLTRSIVMRCKRELGSAKEISMMQRHLLLLVAWVSHSRRSLVATASKEKAVTQLELSYRRLRDQAVAYGQYGSLGQVEHELVLALRDVGRAWDAIEAGRRMVALRAARGVPPQAQAPALQLLADTIMEAVRDDYKEDARVRGSRASLLLEAQECARKAIELLQPCKIAIHHHFCYKMCLAYVLEERGQWHHAIPLMKECLGLGRRCSHFDTATACYLLSRTLVKLKRVDEAEGVVAEGCNSLRLWEEEEREKVKKYIRYYFLNSAFRCIMGDIQAERKQLDEALQSYDAVVQAYPPPDQLPVALHAAYYVEHKSLVLSAVTRAADIYDALDETEQAMILVEKLPKLGLSRMPLRHCRILLRELEKKKCSTAVIASLVKFDSVKEHIIEAYEAGDLLLFAQKDLSCLCVLAEWYDRLGDAEQARRLRADYEESVAIRDASREAMLEEIKRETATAARERAQSQGMGWLLEKGQSHQAAKIAGVGKEKRKKNKKKGKAGKRKGSGRGGGGSKSNGKGGANPTEASSTIYKRGATGHDDNLGQDSHTSDDEQQLANDDGSTGNQVEQDEEVECSICFLLLDQESCELMCGHLYHNWCVEEWIGRCASQGLDVSCPYCRQSIVRR